MIILPDIQSLVPPDVSRAWWPSPPTRPEPPTVIETDKGVEPQISHLASRLAETGLDLGNSTVAATSSTLDFHLEFDAGSVQRLTAEGVYQAENRSLYLTWNYAYQQAVTVDGRGQLRSYEARMSLSVTQAASTARSPFVVKEDIMSFVRRLLEDISEVVSDENLDLGGVVLKLEDLAEILALDNGRLARRLVALIQLTILMARLEQLLESERDEVVILRPERGQVEGIMVEETFSEITEFQLEIRDITAELTGRQPALLSDVPYQEGDGTSVQGNPEIGMSRPEPPAGVDRPAVPPEE